MRSGDPDLREPLCRHLATLSQPWAVGPTRPRLIARYSAPRAATVSHHPHRPEPDPLTGDAAASLRKIVAPGLTVVRFTVSRQAMTPASSAAPSMHRQPRRIPQLLRRGMAEDNQPRQARLARRASIATARSGVAPGSSAATRRPWQTTRPRAAY
jgi:hypothetical protein